MHQGVYAVGSPTLSVTGRFMAAVLACGPGAALSHRSAAVLWEIWKSGPRGVDVTVPGDRGRRRAGIVVHRSPLPENHVTARDGIPVTTPARTLIDLADVVNQRTLERAIEEAEYLRLDCAGLEPIAGRAGSGRLARVLEEHRAGSTYTRSQLEERFLAACRRRRMDAPEVNAYVEGHEVNFVWREARLIVELDGRQAHLTRRAFERDRVRDGELLEAGWRILRVTHARMAREPDAVAGQVDRLLRTAARRAPTGRPASSPPR